MKLCSLLGFIALFVPKILLAQSFAEYNRKAIECYRDRNFSCAQEYAMKALPFAEKELGSLSENFGMFLHNLGRIYLDNQEYQEAQKAFESALLIRKASLGSTHLLYAKTLQRVAKVSYELRDFARSESALMELIHIYQVSPSHWPSELSLAYHDLLQIYIARNELNRASRLGDSLLSHLPPERSHTQPIYLDLARIESQKGNYENSLAYYSKLIKAQDPNGKAYNVILNAQIHHESAMARIRLGHLDEGSRLHQESLDLIQEVHQKDASVYKSLFLSELSDVYLEQKHFELAQASTHEALAYAQIAYGEGHPIYAQVLSRHAQVLLLLNKSQNAEVYTQKALSIFKETMGDINQEYARCLYYLGKVYESSQRYNQADSLLNCSIQIANKLSFDDSSPLLISSRQALSKVYIAQQRYHEAETLIQANLKVQSQSERLQTQLDYAISLGAIIEVYLSQEKNQAALDKSLKLQEQLKQIPKDQVYVDLLGRLAAYFYQLKQWNSSEICYRSLLDHLQTNSSQNAFALVSNLDHLASLYANWGQFQKAGAIYALASKKALAVKAEFPDLYARVHLHWGLHYKKLHQLDSAHYYLKQARGAIQNAQQADHKLLEAVIYRNWANLFRAEGNYTESEPKLLKSLEIIHSLGESNYPSEHANILYQLALLYKTLGDAEKAEKLVLRALQLQDKYLGKSSTEYAQSLHALANLYRSQKAYEQAEPLYKEAMQIRKTLMGPQDPQYATSLDDLAGFYLSQNKLEEARSLYDEAITIRENQFGKDHPKYASSLNDMAVLLEQMGHTDDAEAKFLQAEQIFRLKLGKKHPDYAKVLNNLAGLYDSKQDYSQAETYYQQSVDIMMSQIQSTFRYLSEEEKKLFYNNYRIYIDNFVQFSLHKAQEASSPKPEPQLGDIYNLQLLTKGLILQATSMARQRILQSGDSSLIAKFYAWRSIRENIAQLYKSGNSPLSISEFNLDSLEYEANLLEKELSLASQKFAEVYNPSQPKWQDVQSQLRSGEAAIEMIRLESSEGKIVYAALILKAGQQAYPELVILSQGSALEAKVLNYYRNITKYQASDRITYQEFWEPIHLKLAGVRKVYFSPDGVYNQINLNTLKNPHTQKYLIEELDITLLTSTRELLEAPSPSLSPESLDAILVGRPSYYQPSKDQKKRLGRVKRHMRKWNTRTGLQDLPYSEAEIRQIDSLLLSKNWNTTSLLGKKAREGALKNLKSPYVLHIASHGFFLESQNTVQVNPYLFSSGPKGKESSPEDPMFRSGLLLSSPLIDSNTQQGNQEDGILTAYEAMHLSLDNTEMVVLSACETGLGAVHNGEGVYGLQRALKIAGAQTILMSLWKIDDKATQELMRTFYIEWLNSGNKREAFRKAQIKLRKAYPNPYYWGAFVMVGP